MCDIPRVQCEWLLHKHTSPSTVWNAVTSSLRCVTLAGVHTSSSWRSHTHCGQFLCVCCYMLDMSGYLLHFIFHEQDGCSGALAKATTPLPWHPPCTSQPARWPPWLCVQRGSPVIVVENTSRVAKRPFTTHMMLLPHSPNEELGGSDMGPCPTTQPQSSKPVQRSSHLTPCPPTRSNSTQH